jgi:hypothetical protein
VKKPRLISVGLVGLGATVAVRAVAKFLDEFGELCEEVELGYPSANALPIIGHPGFPDTSGVRLPVSSS